MESTTREKRIRWIWGICLVLMWGCALLLFIKTNGKLSIEELLRYKPENPWLAALAMLGLYLLKSVDFLMHTGVLCAISAILFPLPAAFAVNLIGLAIISAVPYFIGKNLGAPILALIRNRYPKLRRLESLHARGVFFFAVLLRCVGVPVFVVGVYFGARKDDFAQYMAGSVLGMLPMMIPFTLLGESAADFTSPVFLAAIVTRVVVLIGSILLYRHMLKKESASREK